MAKAGLTRGCARAEPRVTAFSSRALFPLTHISLSSCYDLLDQRFALRITPCYPSFYICIPSLFFLVPVMFVEILYQVRTCPKLLRWLAVLVLVLWLGIWHHPLQSSKQQTHEAFAPLVREHIDQGSGHGGSRSCDSRIENSCPLTH